MNCLLHGGLERSKLRVLHGEEGGGVLNSWGGGRGRDLCMGRREGEMEGKVDKH